MTQVCINQHFVEKRGTAAGVVEALAAINGIVFPPLLEVGRYAELESYGDISSSPGSIRRRRIEGRHENSRALLLDVFQYSLRSYGLHWSMLLLGGCVLNALAFSFTVRSPSWMVQDPKQRRKSIFNNAVVANKGKQELRK